MQKVSVTVRRNLFLVTLNIFKKFSPLLLWMISGTWWTLRILSWEGKERQQREEHQRMLKWDNVAHKPFSSSKSHLKLAHWGQSWINPTATRLAHVSCTLHSTGTTFWTVNTPDTHTLDCQKTEWREEYRRGKRNLTGTGNAESNLSVIRDVKKMARRWLRGVVRKKECKLIGLCLFILDMLLNQTWQVWRGEGEWECLKNMPSLHKGFLVFCMHLAASVFVYSELRCAVALYLPWGP